MSFLTIKQGIEFEKLPKKTQRSWHIWLQYPAIALGAERHFRPNAVLYTHPDHNPAIFSILLCGMTTCLPASVAVCLAKSVPAPESIRYFLLLILIVLSILDLGL